jgi:hypothetical protein
MARSWAQVRMPVGDGDGDADTGGDVVDPVRVLVQPASAAAAPTPTVPRNARLLITSG